MKCMAYSLFCALKSQEEKNMKVKLYGEQFHVIELCQALIYLSSYVTWLEPDKNTIIR